MLRCLLSLLMVSCLCAAALGDVPPPPPEFGFKRVPYENLLKLGPDVAGYKFFPFQRLGLGGQEVLGEELKLGTETGVLVPSTSSPSVRTGVVAVPDKVLEELQTKENLAKLLSRENKEPLPQGVVVYETFGTIEDLRTSDPRSKVENVITVSLDETAGVKFTAAEVPGPAATPPPYGMLIAGAAATLALVTLGVWLVRRKST